MADSSLCLNFKWLARTIPQPRQCAATPKGVGSHPAWRRQGRSELLAHPDRSLLCGSRGGRRRAEPGGGRLALAHGSPNSAAGAGCSLPWRRLPLASRTLWSSPSSMPAASPPSPALWPVSSSSWASSASAWPWTSSRS